MKKNNEKFLDDLLKSYNDLKFIYEKKVQEQNALSDSIKKRQEIINETNRMICNLQNDTQVLTINNDLISKNISSKHFRTQQLEKQLKQMGNLNKEFNKSSIKTHSKSMSTTITEFKESTTETKTDLNFNRSIADTENKLLLENKLRGNKDNLVINNPSALLDIIYE